MTYKPELVERLRSNEVARVKKVPMFENLLSNFRGFDSCDIINCSSLDISKGDCLDCATFGGFCGFFINFIKTWFSISGKGQKTLSLREFLKHRQKRKIFPFKGIDICVALTGNAMNGIKLGLSEIVK